MPAYLRPPTSSARAHRSGPNKPKRHQLATLIEPGPVATDGASKAARYDSPPGYSQVAQTVNAIADTLEAVDPPLHVPVGSTARRLIAAARS